MTTCQIINGDALTELRKLPAESVQCCVTDPPYGLNFMGKDWDRGIPGVAYWAEVLRVCKPGAHLLAFGGTRTFHRLACAIEDAGWEIRDCLMWVYGSGFPKSLDVGKAIDKAAGAPVQIGKAFNRVGRGERAGEFDANGRTHVEHEPQTPAAREWSGWGTALKPAWEPIILARKPLDGTVAENVQKHGCGALNIDGCRVEATDGYTKNAVTQGINTARTPYAPAVGRRTFAPVPAGRWPANLIHDGSEEVVACFPESKGQLGDLNETGRDRPSSGRFGDMGPPAAHPARNDSGSAARFFYCAKATAAERAGSNHPTVKPLALIEYLIRLVSCPGDTVLDPFAGSGTTGEAAQKLGQHVVLIDKDPETIESIRRRTAQTGIVLG